MEGVRPPNCTWQPLIGNLIENTPAPPHTFAMSASQVIEEIKHLPPDEQAEVIRFAFQLARNRQLTGAELADLAKQMVESKDPAVANQLRAEIVRGFYGSE